MSLISVIIPLYNARATLPQTLNSVLAQSFNDFEVIVVDDGSTDGSLEWVQEVNDPRVRVFSYANGGAAVARNRGVKHAVGEAVAFLDADDYWTPDKLAAQWQALQVHPEAAVAHSWTQFVNEQGQVFSQGCKFIANVSEKDSAYRALLVTNVLESGSNPLIQRQALLDIGGFDESLKSSQDQDLYIRLAARYPFVTVPRYQIFYRIMASNSISSNIERQEQEALRVYERTFAEAPSAYQYLRTESLATLYRYLVLRGLESRSSPRLGRTLARCYANVVRYKPTLLKTQTRLMTTMLVKILVMASLPSQQSQSMLAWLRHRSD